MYFARIALPSYLSLSIVYSCSSLEVGVPKRKTCVSFETGAGKPGKQVWQSKSPSAATIYFPCGHTGSRTLNVSSRTSNGV